MTSPFPGMDPYLEDDQFWPSFHRALVESLRELLQPALLGRYEAHVGERRYALDGGERCEPYVEVRRRDGDQLVTLLDVVSPANKTTDAGRAAYLATRRQALDPKAGTVEVDLITQGTPTLDYTRDGLPPYDHAVTVTRSTLPDRYEIYTATIQKRLPKFKFPLAADRDTVLDLQFAVGRAYDRAGCGGRIDYRRDPAVPLSEEARRRLDELLRAKGLRCGPRREEVAVAAYFLWEQEGRPTGRDREHWQRAEEQLRRPS